MILCRFRSVLFIPIIIFLLLISCNKENDNQAKSVSEAYGDDVYLLPSNEQLLSMKMTNEPIKISPEGMPEVVGDLFDDFESYDVTSMVMADYVDDAGKDQYVVELYRFPDSKMAFGFYSIFRLAHIEILPLGTQGFIKPGQLCFLKDRFVVCVNGNENSDGCMLNLLKLAEVVDENISGTTEMPEELAVFHSQGKVENSEGYFDGDFLFRGNIVPAFSARYMIDQRKVTAFYIPLEGKECLNRYLQYISENGKVIEEYQSQGLLRYYIDDPLNGNVLLYYKDDRCAGAMGSIDFTRYPEFIEGLRAVVETP